MIGDVVERSLRSPQVLISVGELYANAAGSRMPDVQPDLLTDAVARRVVAACPTSALKIDDDAGRTHLILNYGECTGCGRCIAAGGGTFRYAEKVTRCGVSKQALIRSWDIQGRAEVVQDEPALDRKSTRLNSSH